jgi:hypothetical protein
MRNYQIIALLWVLAFLLAYATQTIARWEAYPYFHVLLWILAVFCWLITFCWMPKPARKS